MKIQSLIQKLLPREKKFFTFLEEAAANTLRAAESLESLVAADQGYEREALIRKITEIEHKGDAITHTIFAELNSTFVTPFDREDIHGLASALDDIVDHIRGTALRFSLYQIEAVPRSLSDIARVLLQSVSEVAKGVRLVSNLNRVADLQVALHKINEYENQADDIFEAAIAELFHSKKDPVEIIKLKEVFVSIETATDKCEDAANVIESIVLKYG